MVNYTIKCNSLGKKEVHINLWYNSFSNKTKTKEKYMNYHHFTIEERCCLREYYVKGKSYREIARLLGRNVSSVSRELRRNRTFQYDIPHYYPYTAQKKSNLRNSYRHRGMFRSQEVLNYIDEKLSLTWSRTNSKYSV